MRLLAAVADISGRLTALCSRPKYVVVLLQGGSIGGSGGTGGGNRVPAAVAEVSEEDDGKL